MCSSQDLNACPGPLLQTSGSVLLTVSFQAHRAFVGKRPPAVMWGTDCGYVRPSLVLLSWEGVCSGKLRLFSYVFEYVFVFPKMVACFGYRKSKLKTKPKETEYVPMETRGVFVLVNEAAPSSGIFPR